MQLNILVLKIRGILRLEGFISINHNIQTNAKSLIGREKKQLR